jgi:membrane-associated phospholipid phosphatase
MRRSTLATGAVVATAWLALAPAVHANVINDWCATMLQTIRTDRTAPPIASRAMAMTMVAAYDAVAALQPSYEPYHVTAQGPAGASAEAAAAQAAHDVLVALFPAQAATLDDALATSLAAVPAGTAKSDGIAWGAEVAAAILDLRADDGSTQVVDYTPPTGAGWWEPTPPAYGASAFPQWGQVTPWAMTHGAQFRPAPPPSLRSTEYTQAFHEVRLLGRADSPLRTADQSEIALFWADGPGTTTPPGHWFVIADDLARVHGFGVLDTARTLALLGITVADAAIVGWDAKYTFDHWRPVTGIREAAGDGNGETPEIHNWTPFITTPPFPAYPSGHSTFSGGAARLLAHVFGSDAIAITTTSDALPGVVRHFDSLSAAAEEAGQSRIYGGIHWQHDNTAGLSAGRALADHVYHRFLRPQTGPGTCAVDSQTLCLGGDRFSVTAIFDAGHGKTAAGAIEDSDQAGRFWFFHPGNIELDVKVLDGCTTNDQHWVFLAGLTNLEVTVHVLDTHTGASRSYYNAAGGAFTPVQDTVAFPCH